MKILSIVGARPNFMKVAPLHRVFTQAGSGIQSKIVHTGQHFDEKMSEIFFNQLSLPKPDYFLGVGHGSHSEVTARILLGFEPVLHKEQPDLVIVVGDVTSTLACALVTQRNGIKLAHVEAGLRSKDRSMPEEVNRILTDQISDYLFTTERSALNNLMQENIPENKVHFVGNCMIDSLDFYSSRTNNIEVCYEFGVLPQKYILMTMHRPSNVDSKDGLMKIYKMLKGIEDHQTKVIFPMHPRTKAKLVEFDLLNLFCDQEQLIITDPLGYIEFITLMRYARLVLTDSGGVQEESTYLNIPCLTFRKSTERPITVEVGSNILLDELDPSTAVSKICEILNGNIKKSGIPEFWDGKAAMRILEILKHSIKS